MLTRFYVAAIRLARRARLALSGTRLAREQLAAAFLRGSGLEIGALHNPLVVPRGVRVTYVDRLSVEELRRHYPELEGHPLAPVGIVDDGTRLERVASASQDFVIANHFIEHCEDPIGALKSFARVLREGGVICLVVPDKRFTFDRLRPVTTLEHLVRDQRNGPAVSRQEHFREWARLVDGISDEAALAERVAQLAVASHSIHFHVWTSDDWLKFICAIAERNGLEVAAFLSAAGECFTILRKRSNSTHGAAGDASAEQADPAW